MRLRHGRQYRTYIHLSISKSHPIMSSFILKELKLQHCFIQFNSIQHNSIVLVNVDNNKTALDKKKDLKDK